jgi:hypothetical protein
MLGGVMIVAIATTALKKIKATSPSRLALGVFIPSRGALSSDPFLALSLPARQRESKNGRKTPYVTASPAITWVHFNDAAALALELGHTNSNLVFQHYRQ